MAACCWNTKQGLLSRLYSRRSNNFPFLVNLSKSVKLLQHHVKTSTTYNEHTQPRTPSIVESLWVPEALVLTLLLCLSNHLLCLIPVENFVALSSKLLPPTYLQALMAPPDKMIPTNNTSSLDTSSFLSLLPIQSTSDAKSPTGQVSMSNAPSSTSAILSPSTSSPPANSTALSAMEVAAALQLERKRRSSSTSSSSSTTDKNRFLKLGHHFGSEASVSDFVEE
ncbi:hypothetical protein BJ546DRAFT_954222 [Cryomyces antarcticus]